MHPYSRSLALCTEQVKANVVSSFSSYITGIIILHAAVQKMVIGYPCPTYISDLRLVNSCTQVLRYCAQVDKVASDFEAIIVYYQNVIHKGPGEVGSCAASLKHIDEDFSVDYLLDTPVGDGVLHKAARDLLLLIQKPFTDALELYPKQQQATALQKQETLVNWAEAAVGSTQEWIIEWNYGGNNRIAEALSSEACSSGSVEMMSQINPGHFMSTGGNIPWS